MEEFLSNYYSSLTKGVEFTAALVGILVYQKYKNTNVKYFIWLLIGIAILELIGGYTIYAKIYDFEHLIKDTWYERNHWLYTIFWQIGASIGFAFYFRSFLKSQFFKKLILIGVLLFVVGSIFVIASQFDLFFVASFKPINISSSLLIILSVTLYLIELLQSDEILKFYSSINFIIATVLLIWNLITTPLIFYDIYFNRDDRDYIILKSSIMLFSNIFMYITFTIALICCKPKNV